MAAIETTEEVMDKLHLNVARLGISTIRKLQILFAKIDPDEKCQVCNEEFMRVLMKNGIYLSKIDLSSVLKTYKVNELEINYSKFMNDLSPALTNEREEVVKQLFDLIRAHTKQKESIILYRDLMSLCNFNLHPAVQSGQFAANYAREMITTAFDSIQNNKDEITYTKFKYYFRGISAGYPFNTNAFINFIKSCWCAVFKNVNNGNFSDEEAKKYVEQIEAMLAEKTRQKVKGSENENRTLLRQFKHFDNMQVGYVNYMQFVRTLESFGVLAPDKELQIMFDKWCHHEPDKENSNNGGYFKKLYYRQFVEKLFKKN